MQNKAQTLVSQAQSEVDRMLAQANQEVANWVSEASAEGAKQGTRQAEQLRVKLGQLCDLMQKEMEGDVLLAAFESAKELIETELSSSPMGLVQIVQTALKAIPEITQANLRVNPLDAPVLREHKQAIIDVMERAKEIDIREDKQVERGGVLIHTDSGVIDAQLSTQLGEIARVLGV